MYSNFAKLLEERKLTAYRVSKDTGISQTTLSEWKKGLVTPKADKLRALAEYLGVSVDYLLAGEDFIQKETPALTRKDERDISKKLHETLEQLEKAQDGLMFDGEPLDEVTRELLLASLKNGLETSKKIAKQKFTPKKYK